MAPGFKSQLIATLLHVNLGAARATDNAGASVHARQIDTPAITGSYFNGSAYPESYTPSGNVSIDSTEFTPFDGVISGAAGFTVWQKNGGSALFGKAYTHCTEYYNNGRTAAEGVRCVANAFEYLMGLTAACGLLSYVVDGISPGIGAALQFLTPNKGKRDINLCDLYPAGCDEVSSTLVAHLAEKYAGHRVTHLVPDESVLSNGHRMTIKHQGSLVAQAHLNGTHHFVTIGQDLTDHPHARRDYLPTQDHFWSWGGALAGIKAQGKHFATPADTVTYVQNIRNDINELSFYKTSMWWDGQPYTACSTYLHQKVYDGKWVFESEGFGYNFEPYNTYACPPFSV